MSNTTQFKFNTVLNRSQCKDLRTGVICNEIYSRKLRAKVIVNKRISYGKELSSPGRVQSCVEGLEGNRERSSSYIVSFPNVIRV